MVKDTKLYDILEVDPSASAEEINQSYKKLAKKYHPDKNLDDPHASSKLQEINEAKEILLNPDKRNMYDQVGMDFLQNNGNQGGGPNPEDLFNMFGGFNNMRQHQQKQKENIVIHETVSLNKVYNEESISISYKQKHVCVNCKGEGSNNGTPTKCAPCNGQGMVIQTIRMGPMIQQVQAACNHCRGSGKILKPENMCKECSGEGTKLKEVRLNIPLKNGLEDGQQIQLPNQGHVLKDGKTDLLIIIHIEEHPIFKRSGTNLIINIELKLFQAMFGFDKIIEHLDNRKLYISHTGKIENNTNKKILNDGMKSLQTNTKGDLIINFTYKLPNINNVEYIQKLQPLLKLVDQEEANRENEIKNNKTAYEKVTLSNHDTANQPERNATRVNTEEHHQQCSPS